MAKFPFHSNSFFTDESVKSPDVTAVVGKYKKSALEHIEAHLKLMFKTLDHTALNFNELVSQTVDGEYKLVLVGANAVFEFNDGDIMGLYNTGEQLDVTNGIPIAYDDTDPNWFSAEINTTGNGAKFMLPSLGTEVIKLHTFGNQTDLIKKCFVNEVKAFCRHFHDNNSFDLSDMPEVFYEQQRSPAETPSSVYNEIMGLLGSGITAPAPFPDVSPVPLIVLRHILRNPDINTSLLNNESIANTVRTEYNSTYHSSDEDSTMEIVSSIFGKLFAKSNSQVVRYLGRPIVLADNNTDHIRDHFSNTYGVDPDEYNYEYRLSTGIVTTNNNTNTYTIELFDTLNNSPIGTYPDLVEVDNGNHQRVSENQFSMVPNYEEDGTGDARRGKGVQLSPPELVNQRVILDAFFYMQVYTHLHKKYDTNFTTPEKWNSAHVKLRYISDLSNTSHRKQAILERHSNLFHPKNNRPTPPTPPRPKEFHGKKEKPGQQLVSVLSNLRGYYTLSILSIIRSKSVDKEVMDRVYASSLLKQEVNWLIGAVSDSGKALVEKRVENDPLTRVQYQSVAPPAPSPAERAVPPPGRPPGPQARIADALETIIDRPPVITEFGYSPKRTVFYEVESPLFKDIVSTYSEVFNEFTIMVAYNKEKAKDIKEAELARSIWTSIEKRNTNIFDREDIIPFRLFDILFTKIEEKARQSSIVANIYPDTWATTNNVTLLKTDPVITGQPVEREFYQARLNEFIAHLSRVFKTNHRIPAIIVSVIEQAKISSTKDVTALKREFEERLDRDAKLKKLSSTTVKFHAYELMISILRAYIMIDVAKRNEFVAQRIDETQRQRIRTNLVGNSTDYAKPPNYPST